MLMNIFAASERKKEMVLTAIGGFLCKLQLD